MRTREEGVSMLSFICDHRGIRLSNVGIGLKELGVKDETFSDVIERFHLADFYKQHHEK